MVCVVIMAGGKGERFWPKSRLSQPKQFTDLTGDGNMLYLTYKRVLNFVEPERVFVVTGAEYKDITQHSLPQINEDNIIIEPEGRNTAPCIGLAAIVLEKRYPGSTMIVLPADHLVKDEEAFIKSLKTAVELAESTGGLVTLGIKPTRPETGYGYLKTGKPAVKGNGDKALRVDRFVEKPDPETAAKFLLDGSYLWNAGIFIWQVSVILEEFKRHLPEMHADLVKIKESIGTGRFGEVLSEVYPGMQKVSIDYGIMEKAGQVYTVSGAFDWDDVGTWKALERVFGTDENGNLLRGNVVSLGTTNTIVDAGNRLVALIGLEDLVVVDTEDITFVCHKNQTDQVRELLNEIRSLKLDKYL